MVDQVNNHDIIDAGNTIADLLTSINDNLIEQNERVSSNASMISGICRQLDELKEARPNLTVVIREAIHEAVVEELDGRDILDTDGVEEVINDYDMSGKIEDELSNSGYVTGDDFDSHLTDHGVAYSHDVEDMITEDDVRDTVEAMFFDRKLKEAEASDPDLFDIHMKNIGRQAVVAFKAEQAKLKEEKVEVIDPATLPPLPQTSGTTMPSN